MTENLMFASFTWQAIGRNFHIVPDLKAKKNDTDFVSRRWFKQKAKKHTHAKVFWEQYDLSIRDCSLFCVLFKPRVDNPSGSENILIDSVLTMLLLVVKKHFSNGLTFNIWSNTPTRT